MIKNTLIGSPEIIESNFNYHEIDRRHNNCTWIDD